MEPANLRLPSSDPLNGDLSENKEKTRGKGLTCDYPAEVSYSDGFQASDD